MNQQEDEEDRVANSESFLNLCEALMNLVICDDPPNEGYEPIGSEDSVDRYSLEVPLESSESATRCKVWRVVRLRGG